MVKKRPPDRMSHGFELFVTLAAAVLFFSVRIVDILPKDQKKKKKEDAKESVS